MHLRRYLDLVARSWWNLMALVGGVLGIASGVSGVDSPRWLWLTLVVGGVVLAQAQVARAIHEPGAATQTEGQVGEARQLTAVIEGAAAPESTAAIAARSPGAIGVLQPELLQGRVYPYMQSPVVQTTERALPVRVAAAAAVPQNLVVEIDGRAQDVFENAVATSLLERWVLAMTTHGRPDLIISGSRSIRHAAGSRHYVARRRVWRRGGHWTRRPRSACGRLRRQARRSG